VSIGTLLAALSLAIWAYLLLARGDFWRAAERDPPIVPKLPDSSAPTVTAVIPARDEADVVGRAISSLLAQDFAGRLDIVLVDDQSSDGTAETARRAATALGASGRLTVLAGRPLPAGWTGKLWALQQGIDHVLARPAPADFLLLTDADIAYAPETVTGLVAEAAAEGLVLNSRMAKLTCDNPAERALIPAFIFFFQMLYPFAWVNRPARPIAAAAGGCMLARREALEKAGGLAAIRGQIIDDCALGRAMKRQGPIWLGLTERAVSLRPYDHIADIQHMVTRTAYAQLGYSPLVLGATLLGLAMVYLAPVMTALFAWGPSQLAGWLAWIIMAVMYVPMLRFYRLSWLWSPALPLIGVFYAVFTFQSALQHWSGKGGMWKGRAQADAGGGP